MVNETLVVLRVGVYSSRRSVIDRKGCVFEGVGEGIGSGIVVQEALWLSGGAYASRRGGVGKALWW